MKDHESRWSLFFKTASYIYLFFVIGMVQGVIGPSLALLKQHTNVSESAIETIVVARGVGWLLGSLAAGALFQKMDGHRIVWIALLLMSAMHCVIPFIPQFSVLFGAFGVIGLAGGVLEAGKRVYWSPLLAFPDF
jgi:fucose permease